MKPETKPDTLAAATPTEAQWVQAELIRGLMKATRNTQPLGLLLVPVMMGVMWSAASLSALLAWALAASAVAGARFRISARYGREVMAHGALEQIEFYGRYRWLWPVSAFVWGASTLLFFDRSSLTDQYICWLILAGLAMFSINSLSSQLASMRAYIDTMALTALGVMLWRVGVELQFGGPLHHLWIIALVVIFWQVLRRAGQRLHLTHRRNFELQFRNNQLIESLTRQTQAALDAVEIKNRFLASAAHDIRQPVLALGLYADWLSNEPELVHEIAPKIVESTKAVNALFDSLFDLARLDAGKISLNIEPVDLAKLVRELELQYRPLAQAKGLSLRVRIRPGTVLSDPILLRRIVGNLLSNGIKYTERGGVLVATRRTATSPVIEVWDTGLGIAPGHQREIFREFYKVPAHGGTEDGFGLGLYIVARLATILGHPLSLSSRPRRGTVFRVRLLPTDEQEAARRAASQLVSMP